MYKFLIKLRIAKQFGKTLCLQKIHLPSNKQERLPGPEPGNTFHYLNQSLASCLATHYLTESLFTTVQLDRSESEAGATRSDTFGNFLISMLKILRHSSDQPAGLKTPKKSPEDVFATHIFGFLDLCFKI